MPYKSHSQMRKFFAMAGRGEISEATAHEWAHKTKNLASLPERKRKRPAKPKT